MANIFVRNGNHHDDDDIALGIPDESEATDLNRHVDRCAMRYRMFTSKLKMHGDSVKRIEYILYGVAIWLLATSPFAQDMLRRLLGTK